MTSQPEPAESAEAARVRSFIAFHSLERCEFDGACDRCSSPTGGSWVQLSYIPQDVTEANYYICGGCIQSRAAAGWCRTCGSVDQSGELVTDCEVCREWEHIKNLPHGMAAHDVEER